MKTIKVKVKENKIGIKKYLEQIKKSIQFLSPIGEGEIFSYSQIDITPDRPIVYPVFTDKNMRLYDHQISAVKFFEKHKKVAIIHSPGSGKTITALSCAYHYTQKYIRNYVPTYIYIITPPRVKKQWEYSVNLIQFSNQAKIYILSYTDLIYDKFPPIPEDINNRKTLLIIDEIHNIKGKGAYYKGITDLHEKIQPKRIVALSATPIMTNADSAYLFALLHNRLKYIESLEDLIKRKGRKIIGIDSDIKVKWLEKSHIFVYDGLRNSLGKTYVYFPDPESQPEKTTAEIALYQIKEGKIPLIYTSTRESADIIEYYIASNLKIINKKKPVVKIHTKYDPEIKEILDTRNHSSVIMTLQMGEGIDLGGIADTIIYHDAPWGLDLLLQTLARIIRINKKPDNPVDLYFREYKKLDSLMELYYNQAKYYFTPFMSSIR